MMHHLFGLVRARSGKAKMYIIIVEERFLLFFIRSESTYTQN